MRTKTQENRNRNRARAAFQTLEPRRYLSAGDLDLAFSGDGIQTIDIPGGTGEIANAVLATGSNGVLTAGKVTVGGQTDFAITMLLATGAPDTSFGGGDGILTIDFGGNDEAFDIAFDGFGRIVVTGKSASTTTGVSDFAIARLGGSGLDTNFSGDGKLLVDFGGNEVATGIAANGTFLHVGGYKDLGATGQFLLARINDSGNLDTGFSTDGKVFFGFGGNNDSRCYDIAVDDTGATVMVGYDENLAAAGHTRDLAIARVGTNALLDSSFSSNGLLTFNVGENDELRAVGIDHKDRIVVAGLKEPVSGGDNMIALRLTTAGTSDTSFSGDGRVEIDLGNVDRASDLAIGLDNTITLSGLTLASGIQAAVVQISPFDGSLSTSFGDGGDGIQLVNFGAIEDGFAVSLDRNLRPVIAGTDGSGRIAVGRLRDLIDNNFAVNAPEFVENMLALPDGKLLVRQGVTITRLHPGGQLDNTFTPITLDFFPREMTIDWLDRIVVGGVGSGTPRPGVLARYLPDGAPDASFSNDGRMTFSFEPGRESSVSGIDTFIGDIVVVGSVPFGGLRSNDAAIARVTDSGVLDTDLAGDGTAVLSLNLTDFDTLNDVIDLGNGQIVAVGRDGNDAVAIRVEHNGSLDTDFAGNGIKRIGFGVGNSGRALRVLRNADKYLIGGYCTSSSDIDSGFLARLEDDGDLDPLFGNNGLLSLQFNPNGEQVHDFDFDSAGNIVTVGTTLLESFDDSARVLVRKLFANGSAGVFSFSGDGAWVAPFDGIDTTGNTFHSILAGGAIYVTGNVRVTRLNAPPVVVDFEFEFETAPQRLRVQFNDNLSAALADGDLAIRNETTNTLLPVSAYDVASFDPLTNTAIVNFNSILEDGDYTVTFSSTGIRNNQGHALFGDRVRAFFFLNGDANRDGRVNLADFNILAANFGAPNRTFTQGDFNYDNAVNLSDFNILAGRFGLFLGEPSSAGNGTFTGGTRITSQRLTDELEQLV